MSTFPGRMNEYRYISIDRFDGDNLSSYIFMLSHAHEDHMKGLDSSRFINYLAENRLHLYVHEITYHLLLDDKKYKPLGPHLKPLPVNEPQILNVPAAALKDVKSRESVSVTLLPAGHCPGSVMFLFEGDDGTVLYTGDIRLNGEDLAKMAFLRTGDQVKSIKSIYFDSTFCTLSTPSIVGREESVKEIVKLTKQHLDADPENKVLLYCAQKYGHEFLMCKLSDQLNIKVHVTESKYALYKKLTGDIGDYITDDGKSTRVHACAFYTAEDEDLSLVQNKSKPRYRPKGTQFSIPCCPDCRSWSDNVLIIKPSMLWFIQSRSVNNVVFPDKQARVYRVQYSCHSSLAEIREMLMFLRPQMAYPNVKPYQSKDYTPVQEAIRDLIPDMGICLPTTATSRILDAANATVEVNYLRIDSRDCLTGGYSVDRNFDFRKRFLKTALPKTKRRKQNTQVNQMKTGATITDWSSCIDSDNESESEPSIGNSISNSGSMEDLATICIDTGRVTSIDNCIVPAEQPLPHKNESVEITDRDESSGYKEGSPPPSPAPGLGISNQTVFNEYQDSDVDLFDNQDEDSEEHEEEIHIDPINQPSSVISLASSKESLEYIATVRKVDNSPIVILSSDESVDVKVESNKDNDETPNESVVEVINDDEEMWLRATTKSSSVNGKFDVSSTHLTQVTGHSSRKYIL